MSYTRWGKLIEFQKRKKIETKNEEKTVFGSKNRKFPFEKSVTREKTKVRRDNLDKTIARNHLFSDKIQKVSNLFFE